MRIRTKLLSIAFASAILPFTFVNSAQAAGTCTVSTAKQSVSSNTLCACDVVTSGMLRYIQRRADFESILERTILDCPRFAAVLTDLPTASIGLADQRSGDGPSDESERESSNSGPSRDSSPNNDPNPSTPGGENNGNDNDPDDDRPNDNDPDDDRPKDKKLDDAELKDKKSKGKKSKDKKSKDKKMKNKKSKDKKSKNKKSKDKKSKDKKSKNKVNTSIFDN